MRDLEKIRIATQVAWSFHGLPYRWGGNDPMAGFDCSGYVIEILKSVGLLPREGDWRARDLFEKYKMNQFSVAEEGMLVFWVNSKAVVIHIEYCLNSYLAIGASGGGGSTITEQDAIEQDAYIKVRPFKSRANWLGFYDPFLL